jgi:hypothetical protein
MAKLTFINETSAENGFYLQMKDEILKTVNDPDKLFHYFKGTFEIKIGRTSPKAKYFKDPAEEIDEGLLKAHLFLLNYKLIVFLLKNS